MTRDDDPLDDDELWAAEPSEFVAVRDALARRLRAAGRVAAAAEVKATRRPTRDAWVVNRLVAHHPEVVNAVIELGEQLHLAQAEGDAARLRELSARRQPALDAALRAAGPLTAGVAEAVQATLGAALADPEAARAVRSGRLSRGLVYAGLGVAPPVAPRPPTPTAEPRDEPVVRLAAVRTRSAAAADGGANGPDPARLRAAEQALRDAEDEVTATQLARAEAQEEVDRVAAELEEAKSLLADAAAQARSATRARDAAAAALQRLQRRQR